jgi:hypothetical protein
VLQSVDRRAGDADDAVSWTIRRADMGVIPPSAARPNDHRAADGAPNRPIGWSTAGRGLSAGSPLQSAAMLDYYLCKRPIGEVR